jgi:hypothetical protein
LGGFEMSERRGLREADFGPSFKEKIKSLVNSGEDDIIKASILVKSLILLDGQKKFPTAKEITLSFLESNVKKEVKMELANYFLEESYLNLSLLGLLEKMRPKKHSEFIKKVIELVDKDIGEDCIGTDFGFIRRDVVYGIINQSEEPKEKILGFFKEKINWPDFPIQNGILDYCYDNCESLGKDFVMNILDKAVRVNMREVRITALKYAYLVSNEEEYIGLIEKDESSYVRKLARELKR